MRSVIAALCDLVTFDDFNSPTLHNLIDRRFLTESGGALRFVAYFEFEADREPTPRRREARVELVSPEGVVLGAEETPITERETEPGEPLGYAVVTSFDLPGFASRGPHEVRFVVDGTAIASRTLSVKESR